MTKKWLEMRLAVPDHAVDLVSQSLTELGCTGVIAAEKSLDTFVAPAPEKLGNDPMVRAYFPYPENPEQLCRIVSEQLSALAGIYPELAQPRFDYRELADHDWASDWQQHFPPFKVGRRLLIHPSWIEHRVVGDEVVLTLDPGQAFGTGTHATTGLCLDALAELFDGSKPPQRILDVGTGSGILAMAAAALGAETVMACDIDEVSCQVATDNVKQNNLTEKICITDSSLEEIPGSYDLVLANILAAENLRLGSLLVEHLLPGGTLILSGILIEQEQQVLDGFAVYPLTLSAINHRDEWTCIVYRRHE